jgi:O-antigen/teichoic acid export membrane protein
MREAFGIFQLLAIRGGGILSLFLVNILISRHYGIAALGMFQLGLALVMIVAVVARFGQDQLMLREAAEAKAETNVALAHQRFLSSLALSSIGLCIGTALTILFLSFDFGLHLDSGVSTFLTWMAFSILPFGLLMVATETLRGWQRVNVAVAWQGSIPQTLTLIFVAAAALWFNAPVTWVAALYSLALALGGFFAVLVWLRTARASLAWPEMGALNMMMSKARSFWFYAILTVFVAWLDIIILELIGNAEDVGHYSAVVRTGAILGTFVQIVSAGAVAKLALYYASSDFENFTACFRRYFYFFLIAAIPLAAIVLIFPDDIMSIWGGDQAYGSRLFAVYIGFQLLNLCLCLTGFTVVVMHLEKQLVVIQIMAVVAKIALIAFGFWIAGVLGALWGAGISLLIFNLLTGMIFFRKLRQHGVPVSFLFTTPHR